jgi:hypothetical protein
MQTITLSKSQQALVSLVVAWVEEQQIILNRAANERLSPILEELDVLKKQCKFQRTEDGWVLEVQEETASE